MTTSVSRRAQSPDREMQVAHRTAEARRFRDFATRDAATIGLVPTMGFLHEGHLGLVDLARTHADLVVLSIYVNPTQFGPNEDLEAYPRDLDRDLALARDRGVDLVFAPPDAEIYPTSPTITVEPGRLADRLCGRSRPGHFAGVLTAVAKLFGIIRPDVAVFGRKDFQQSVLIRRMVEELRMPIEIVTGPIARGEDGLALSSRNEYLDDEERRTAASLSRGLCRVRRAFATGESEGDALVAIVRSEIVAAGGDVEYAEIVDPSELEPVTEAAADSVCAVAARVGKTRLIDNAALAGPSSLDALTEC